MALDKAVAREVFAESAIRSFGEDDVINVTDCEVLVTPFQNGSSGTCLLEAIGGNDDNAPMLNCRVVLCDIR